MISVQMQGMKKQIYRCRFELQPVYLFLIHVDAYHGKIISDMGMFKYFGGSVYVHCWICQQPYQQLSMK